MANEDTALERNTAPVRERWGNAPLPDDTFDSVESACEEVKRIIGWLEYVAEDEYTEGERDRLIAAAKRFANVAQPIASKYND